MADSLGTASLSSLLRPIPRAASAELVQALAKTSADVEMQKRYDELAEKRSEGTLTPAEVTELESLVRANAVLMVLKAEAQEVLAKGK
jgi:hypothetical protein